MGANEKSWATWHPLNEEQARKLIADFIEFSKAVRNLGPALDKAIQRYLNPMARYGWGQYRPNQEWWISDMCAAWLHESCELPDRCCCTSRGCNHRKEPISGQ